MKNQEKVIDMLEGLHKNGYTLLDLADLFRKTEILKEIEEQEKKTEEQILDEEISEILMGIGITPNLRGFKYIKEAIKIMMKDDFFKHGTNKELYNRLTKIFDRGEMTIYKSIYNAITKAYDNWDIEIQKKYFKGSFTFYKKPSNSKFLANLVDYIRTKHYKG